MCSSLKCQCEKAKNNQMVNSFRASEKSGFNTEVFTEQSHKELSKTPHTHTHGGKLDLAEDKKHTDPKTNGIEMSPVH